jgi:uncharacterized small protein (DUF1192 family)
MTKHEVKAQQLREGIDEMEAAVERLREEIQRLEKERNALAQGNLALYQKLTKVEF